MRFTRHPLSRTLFIVSHTELPDQMVAKRHIEASLFFIKNRRLLFYTALACIFFSQPTFGQLFNFKKYTVKEGLAQNESRVVFKDSEGNIWLGSYQGGVTRYNGQSFEVYTVADGLAHNFIYDIVEDKNNAIWVATGNGISKFVGNKFISYLKSDSVYNKITSIALDSAHTLWFTNSQMGLGSLKEKADSYEVNYNKYLHNFKVSKLIIDKAGRFWVGTQSNGIYIYDGKKIKNIREENGLYSNRINDFFYDSVSNLIHVSTGRGLNFFSDSGLVNLPLFDEVLGEDVLSSFKDSDNKVWVSVHNRVLRFHDDTFEEFNEHNGMPKFVYDFAEDDVKGIWFASYKNVMQFLDESLVYFTMEQGMKDNLIDGVQIHPDGSIWASTEKGISIIDSETLKVRDFALPAEFNDSIPTPVVILPDSRVVLGISGGILEYAEGKFSFIREDGKHHSYTTALAEEDGSIVFAGNNGLIRYQNKSISRLLDHIDMKESKRINAIIKDAEGAYWIGTDGNGMFVYSKDKTLEHLTKREGMPNEIINCILNGQNNDIWFGTSGSGVCKIPRGNIKYNEVITYSEEDFSSNNVYALQMDTARNIWVGTDRGVDKITVLENDNIRVHSYAKQEGNDAFEISRNAIAIDYKGSLWFGTGNGVIEFTPSKKEKNNVLPHQYIKDIKLFFQEVNWEEYADKINQWTGLPINLELPADKNHLTFSFVGVSLKVPEKVRYRWMMEGLEDHWSPPSSKHEAVYSSIPPGNYTFKVISCNDEGVWNEEPATFQFSVVKPFYQTWWFNLLAIIAAVGLIYAYFVYRVSTLQRSRGLLREKLNQKTLFIESQKAKTEEQRLQINEISSELDAKNTEISDFKTQTDSSLTYAGKIQRAILPRPEVLTAHAQGILNGMFVYYKPRETVSGNFYWANTKNGRFIAAVADCPSLGIPGAFISLLCNDFFNKAVMLKGLVGPAEILADINESLITSIEMEAGNYMNDSIDIAILSYCTETGRLFFAGAKQSVYYVQNHTLHIVKGDKATVGGRSGRLGAQFTEKEIDTSLSLSAYIFSDGIAEQIGGANQEKYSIVGFQSLISSIHSRDFALQKDLLDENISQWRGDNKQTKDITVVGLSVPAKPSKK